MRKKNTFLIEHIRKQITLVWLNDFLGRESSTLLFFVNEERAVRQVINRQLLNPLFEI